MIWQERRASIRRVVELPVKYRVVEQNRQQLLNSSLGKTKNVCDGGLLFISPESFPNGTVLEITFPVKDQVFTMRGKVVHSTPESNSKFYHVGIYFPNAD